MAASLRVFKSSDEREGRGSGYRLAIRTGGSRSELLHSSGGIGFGSDCVRIVYA